MERLSRITNSLNGYGETIVNIMLLVVGGMVAVFLLYRLFHTLVKPTGKFSRMLKVVFGAIYAIVLVVTILLAAENIGYDVDALAGPAILVVIIAAVLIFFLIPFLPRLPFVHGDMVDIKGVMGTVDQITTYHTMIRTFNGQIVFMPNALIMASVITNFSAQPNRRVALDVQVHASDDIERARTVLLEIMAADDRVQADPAPAVFVTGVNDGKAGLSAYCWVAAGDWFGTRDALWVAVMNGFTAEPQVSLAMPQLEVSAESAVS